MAPQIDVIVPWAGGDRHRQDALGHVAQRYAALAPDWGFILGNCPTPTWNKALAVADGLRHSDAEIIVVADADVWAPLVGEAVEAVASGPHRWGMPHRWVRRITPDDTLRVFAGGLDLRQAQLDPREYRAFVGGGVVVLRRSAYDACPLDPRFEGWGHEDESWARALRRLFGHRWKPTEGRLWHFWHPPQQRVSRGRGSDASWELRNRYLHAGPKMRDLVAEAIAAYPRWPLESAPPGGPPG